MYKESCELCSTEQGRASLVRNFNCIGCLIDQMKRRRTKESVMLYIDLAVNRGGMKFEEIVNRYLDNDEWSEDDKQRKRRLLEKWWNERNRIAAKQKAAQTPASARKGRR